MKSSYLIVIILLSLIIGGLTSHYVFKRTETITRTERDTTYVHVKVTEKQIVPQFIIKTDTVDKFVFVNPTTNDTTLVDTQYVAKTDTSFISADKIDTTKIKVEYVSPIPLSQLAYFNLDVKYNKRNINTTNYVEVKDGINLFGLNIQMKQGLQAGVGYGIINKSFDVFVGYGITLSF